MQARSEAVIADGESSLWPSLFIPTNRSTGRSFTKAFSREHLRPVPVLFGMLQHYNTGAPIEFSRGTGRKRLDESQSLFWLSNTGYIVDSLRSKAAK
jgi:hypothetical protein